jgi:HPr kinase/phosphorylase
VSADTHLRQVSVERLVADNQDRLQLRWIAGRDGGNRVLTGEAALKPTIGQVGHMNFIHPFRVQLLGAAEIAHLKQLPPAELASSINRLFESGDLVAVVVANGEASRTSSRRAASSTTSRCSRRRSPRRTSSTCSGSTCRACSPSRRRCTACSSTCSRWAC